MELLLLWRRLTRVIMAGNLDLKTLLEQSDHNCISPLYIIVQDQQYVLEKLSSSEKFYKARWLVSKQNDSWLDTINIPFDCELLLLGDAVLEEVYRVSPKHPLVYKKFGDLLPETWPEFELYRRRNNLQGYVMKAAVLYDGIFTTTTEFGKIGGYFGEIWYQLESMMNFTSEFYESVDGGTGTKYNGRWNGMLGMIARGEVMAGASSFQMTTLRMEVVDYTQGLADSGNFLYIRKPDNYLLPWSNSLAPFSARLWFCVVSTILFFTIFLSATASMMYRSGIYDESEFFLRNAWIYIFGIFCQQGHDHICVLLCCLLELLADGTYSVGVIPKSAQSDIFRLVMTWRMLYLWLMNYNINRMREVAVLKIIQERTMKIYKYSQHKDWDTISIDEVIPNFSVFLLGVLTSLLVLITECLVFRVLRRQSVEQEIFEENTCREELKLSKYELIDII
ncbi:hypothetical protein L9F63_022021 [Diploptera punctata]|uniref:Ionotropic glutamate receptor L-glutamate and glycine-binding domain-containing protein n=1 Tax=Diploptera punctata TaxID=6984 RepID=A0AAD7ZMX4_DIPPU|nr:hypothetical protein L9F63_022021 [Diploptera punctata]